MFLGVFFFQKNIILYKKHVFVMLKFLINALDFMLSLFEVSLICHHFLCTTVQFYNYIYDRFYCKVFKQSAEESQFENILFIHQMSATVDLMGTVLCVFAMFIIEIKLINVDSSVFMFEWTYRKCLCMSCIVTNLAGSLFYIPECISLPSDPICHQLHPVV